MLSLGTRVPRIRIRFSPIPLTAYPEATGGAVLLRSIRRPFSSKPRPLRPRHEEDGAEYSTSSSSLHLSHGQRTSTSKSLFTAPPHTTMGLCTTLSRTLGSSPSLGRLPRGSVVETTHSFFRALEKTCGGGSAVDPWSVIQKRYNTRNICGPRFWKTRPKKVPILRFNWRSKWLEGACYRKAVCVKVRVTNPRKPNSGMRKIARVQLPNKRIIRAYIPGIGHNLQAHSVVLVKGGRTHDVRGCNYKLVRGRYDLLPVKNRMRARSQYGVKKPKNNQHGPIVPTTTRFRRITTEEDMAKYEKITGKKMVLEKGEKDAHDKDTYLSPPWPLFSRAKPPFSYGKKKSR